MPNHTSPLCNSHISCGNISNTYFDAPPLLQHYFFNLILPILAYNAVEYDGFATLKISHIENIRTIHGTNEDVDPLGNTNSYYFMHFNFFYNINVFKRMELYALNFHNWRLLVNLNPSLICNKVIC